MGAIGPSTLASCTPPPSATSAGDLTLWTFADTHAGWFKQMATEFEQKTGVRVAVSLIPGSSIFQQLLINLKAGGLRTPDLCDIEQGSFGRFLIGRSVPFVDLGPRLRASGYDKQLVAGRQALYSWKGGVYGVEHALTPVTLFYLRDAWAKAGVDPATLSTWDEFAAAVKESFPPNVRAFPIPPHDVVLRQRGGDYFDAQGDVRLDSDLSVDTMNWLLDLERKGVAAQPPGWVTEGPNPGLWAEFRAHTLTSLVVPDWYAGTVASQASDLSGKWGACPLPAFEPGGRRASCSGGTGLSVLKTSKRQETAWRFLEYSMLRVPSVVKQYKAINLYPPFIPAWSDPHMHDPIPFFHGQDIGALYADVGREVPPQYQSPYRPQLTSQELSPRILDVYLRRRSPREVFDEVGRAVRARQQRGGSVG
ncbi:extracellular solute-binding protein [Actinopolymorpha rutila]|uniref:ABC-type glycerol-3-phosphate transport system substrate-binding protein n=1 Tax=Actinopolymorpha rutila TaxID=446787 RepID=A0A852ZF77_9ACTN|nr:ABC-type glycerol-3-phosphate transport system substrate-binding protein [Actinopolymorpha rutila]